MWLRRAFFRWLIPAAFLLPAWLFVGWIVTGANPWALLWVLLSAPLVLISQLVLTLLVRARGTVRADRAVSWQDAGILGAWHVLIVGLGLFDSRWWWAMFFVTVVIGVVGLWSSLTQLWREARPGFDVLRTPAGVAYVAPGRPDAQRRAGEAEQEVFVVTETPHQPR